MVAVLLVEVDCVPTETILGGEHGLDGSMFDLSAGDGEFPWFVGSCEPTEETGGYDEGAANHDGRECPQAAFGLELTNAVFQAEGKLVGSLTGSISIGLGSFAGVGS